GIVSGGDQCGHVQAMTHRPAAAVDGAFTAHFPTVAIKWCNSDQRRNFTAVELSPLPHPRPEESSRARTYSLDGGQLLCFWRKILGWFSVFFFEQNKLLDLFFFLVDQSAVLTFHSNNSPP